MAELECGQPWHQIHQALDELQVTEFFNLNHRVLMRNELPSKTTKVLKALKIKPPPQVLSLENQA